MLITYVQAAGIDLSSNLKFFHTLHFVRSKASYTLRSTGISYTRAREIVLDSFSQLGFPTKLFGLHSLRSGGATAAANAGVNSKGHSHAILVHFKNQKIRPHINEHPQIMV